MLKGAIPERGRPMKKWMIAVVLLFVVIGCSSASEVEPTLTNSPSDTPRPSATITEITTSTPLPTTETDECLDKIEEYSGNYWLFMNDILEKTAYYDEHMDELNREKADELQGLVDAFSELDYPQCVVEAHVLGEVGIRKIVYPMIDYSDSYLSKAEFYKKADFGLMLIEEANQQLYLRTKLLNLTVFQQALEQAGTFIPTETIEDQEVEVTATKQPEFVKIRGKGDLITDNYEWGACEKAVFYWNIEKDSYLYVDLYKVGEKYPWTYIASGEMSTSGQALSNIEPGKYYLDVVVSTAWDPNDVSWSIRGECKD